MCDVELMVWCGSFPSPCLRKESDNIVKGKYRYKLRVGCAEWCEAHQLVSGLKNFDTRKTDIYILLEDGLSEICDRNRPRER